MFPTPIQKASPFAQTAYKILLPVALFLWLLPLIGVAITSVRPAGDLAAGNYFGIPSGFAGFENYSAVFNNSPIGYYILNSFKVTIPTVIGAVALSCLTGFALGAVFSATGKLEMGVILMGMGLVFQVISLVRIKRAKAKANSEGSSDARG